MASLAGRRLRSAALVVAAIAAATFTSPVTAIDLGFGVGDTARVTAVRYYAELRQNVANLAGAFTSGASYEANFLSNFDRTGGVERWGFPTSAIFEETRGTLTQYYQRGVVDWQPSPGGDRHTFQRRLAWDHLGGGLGGSRDQGVEPGLRNPHPGEAVGPWGHKVSNRSVEGVWTGFADFFRRLGGVASFGYPKTDARRDTHPQAVLHDPGRPVDSRIRQYFQAAVLEYHPESASSPVKLRLLGDTLRNRKYPNNAWQRYPAFTSKPALNVGDDARLDLLEARATGSSNGSVTDTVQQLQPSLLRIETDHGCGSGFFVTDNGWAVTAWHVVEGARSITVTTSSGHRAAASVVAGDKDLDLALLGVGGITQAAPVVWGNSDALPLGSQLVAIGYGATLTDQNCAASPTVTTGLLSNRIDLAGGKYLQTDAALNPGTSGGPVATLGGHVVGITVGSLSDLQNTNFLIPSARAEPMVRSWLDTLGRGGAPPLPPSLPVVLFESAHEQCTGDQDNSIASAAGRELVLKATMTVDSRSPAIAKIYLRNAHEGWENYESIAVGRHVLSSNPDHGLTMSWQRRSGGDWSVVATWTNAEAPAIDYDRTFDIAFGYINGYSLFALYSGGGKNQLEEDLTYGPDGFISLACDDFGDGGTVTFTNITIEGFPLE